MINLLASDNVKSYFDVKKIHVWQLRGIIQLHCCFWTLHMEESGNKKGAQLWQMLSLLDWRVKQHCQEAGPTSTKFLCAKETQQESECVTDRYI